MSNEEDVLSYRKKIGELGKANKATSSKEKDLVTRKRLG